MTRTPLVSLRIVTAGLLGAIAGIHLDLWSGHGYRHIPTIGPLFLLNVVSGIALAVAVLGAERKLLLAAAGLAVGYAAATIAALLVSLNSGLFGFTESTQAPLLGPAVGVDAACIIAAATTAAVAHRAGRNMPSGQRSDGGG